MTTHLRPVADDEMPAVEAPQTPGDIPAFEGHPVDFTRVKLSAAGDLQVDAVNRIDDIVRLYVEGRVVRVDHVVDEASGRMKRVHTIKVVDAIQLPWDFDAEFLDGVDR